MNDYLKKLARNDNEKRLIARLDELVHRAGGGLSGYSDFLDLHQQELARAVVVNGPATSWRLDGGYEQAERKRLVAGPEWAAQADAGLAYLRIASPGYKEDSPSHRDYLGAVLNLGIKREKLGDIVLQKASAILISDSAVAGFISQQLTRVKQNSVSVDTISAQDFVFDPPKTTSRLISLASLRLDAAIAAAFNLPRSEVSEVIDCGKAKINQMEIYKGSAPVKEGDLISVRGRGRFRLEEVGGTSRKGRFRVLISRW